MRKLIFTLVVLMFTTLTFSQWVSNYGNSGSDVNFADAKGNAVTTDNYGNSYVTGKSFEGTNLYDIVTIKYSPEGIILWAKNFNGTANGNDEGNGICLDAAGNIYVVGTAVNTNKYNDVTILKYSSSGDLLWSKSYSQDEQYRDDKGFGVVADRNDHIYVTGYTTNKFNGNQNLTVAKYDPSGNLEWSKIKNEPSYGNSVGNKITVSATGKVYVCGFVTNANSGTDIAVIKYSSWGNELWMNTYNGTGNSEDKAWGIVVDQSDNCFITGNTTGSNGLTDCFTAKYDASGNRVWVNIFNGEGNKDDKAWGIVVDTDGSIYIGGETTTADNNTDYLVLKYSSSGILSWKSFYNGDGNGVDIVSSIALIYSTTSTNVIVTGKSWGPTSTFDYATVRYSALNGVLSQVNRYEFSGISEDIASGVAVTIDNKVVVTGYSEIIVENLNNNSYISSMMMDFSGSLELATENNNSPSGYSLYQNYPNPFNPGTVIKFDIGDAKDVKLTVYDFLGRTVSVLVNRHLNSGTYNISFTNLNLSSGIYFYELSAGDFREVKKMTLVK